MVTLVTMVMGVEGSEGEMVVETWEVMMVVEGREIMDCGCGVGVGGTN